MSGIDFPDDPFWDWSVAIYGRAGVAPACLTLQERHGLDVNLLLFCCWVAGRGQRLTEASLRQIVHDVGTWHREAVRPLRAVRRRLKGGLPAAPADLAEAVRQRVASVELDAEHLEQIMLSRHAAAAAPMGDAAAAETAVANLRACAAVSGFSWTTDDVQPLRTLLEATAPECPPRRIDGLLAATCGGSAL